MPRTSKLEKGRLAAAERRWRDAHTALAAARREASIPADDLWLLAVSSYLLGLLDEFLDALGAAHRAYSDAGDTAETVRTAFWMGQYLASRGEVAKATGWFGRAAREVEGSGAGRDDLLSGYVLLPAGLRQLQTGDLAGSVDTFANVAGIARRAGDGDLMTLAVHAQGRALLRMGRPDDGLALLDEAMLSVMTDELSPLTTGLVYCSVISACREVHALGRAREWTAALSGWCEEQQEMVAYTGPCLASRAELLRREGNWDEAIEEARAAAHRLRDGPGPGTAGPALYELGEVHRLRGAYAAAEEAYREAAQAGYEPQPGLALLRLAQNEVGAAVAALHRVLAESHSEARRALLLSAYVEACVTAGDMGAAREASAELEQIAERWSGRIFTAWAEQARGVTNLAAGDAQGALQHLRAALQEWEELGAPYEVAKVRVSLAAACRSMGDEEGHEMELSRARATFRRLGAGPDLERLEPGEESTRQAAHGLTPREREVLGWLATGRTNRGIGAVLSISEKTVARHVANIYAKLGLSSRAAATAYAYEHGLARTST